MNSWKSAVMIILAVALMAAAPGSSLVAQEEEQPTLPETFSAFAIVMGNIATGANTSIMIRITRWTSPEERQHLLDTIVEKGDDPDALRDELQKQEETGFIRTTNMRSRFPSERLRYAWQWRDGENRRLILALDRPVGFLELRRSGRTLDYGVTIIILDIDGKGEGTGLISTGTKVTYDKEAQRMELEYYSSEPVRLTNVRKTD
jgi:hypothetical protein